MADADVAKRAAEAEARVKELEAQVAKAQDIDEAPGGRGTPRPGSRQRWPSVTRNAWRSASISKRRSSTVRCRSRPRKTGRCSRGLIAMEPSVRDRALELLAAAEGQLALAGALTSVGKGGERRGGGSAYADAQLLARGLVQKGTHTSESEAMTQVLRENPALYERYRKESYSR